MMTEEERGRGGGRTEQRTAHCHTQEMSRAKKNRPCVAPLQNTQLGRRMNIRATQNMPNAQCNSNTAINTMDAC